MNEKLRPLAPVWSQIILYFVLALLYLPLLVMVLGSVWTGQGFSLEWYVAVAQDEILKESVVRSFVLGLLAALGATLLGLISALVLYKTDFYFKKILQFFSVVSIVIPELVFALSLLSWFFILGWPLSLWTVVISHITFCIAFSLFLIGSRLAQMDSTLDQAARDLGASSWMVLWKITLPLLAPALFSSLVLCFLLSFDDFLISYFVSGVGSDTLPIKLYTSMKQGHSPKINALATLMISLTIGLLAGLLSLRSIQKQMKGS